MYYPKHLSCDAKKAYNDINMANDIGKMQMYNMSGDRIGPQLYIYHCEYCNKYHLTQQQAEFKVI